MMQFQSSILTFWCALWAFVNSVADSGRRGVIAVTSYPPKMIEKTVPSCNKSLAMFEDLPRSLHFMRYPKDGVPYQGECICPYIV